MERMLRFRSLNAADGFSSLAFRDALRVDPQVAADYAELKLELARRYPRDREAYIEGKSAFVERILAETRSRPSI